MNPDRTMFNVSKIHLAKIVSAMLFFVECLCVLTFAYSESWRVIKIVWCVVGASGVVCGWCGASSGECCQCAISGRIEGRAAKRRKEQKVFSLKRVYF
jgi:hypothetical protein